MERSKEFQGKSLDEAIQNACRYYDTKREKLEIDIVQDAKSGLFGIVGVRKAIIHARLAGSVRGSVSAILHSEEPHLAETPSDTAVNVEDMAEKPAKSAGKVKNSAPRHTEKERTAPEAASSHGAERHSGSGRRRRSGTSAQEIAQAPSEQHCITDNSAEEGNEALDTALAGNTSSGSVKGDDDERLIPFKELDQDRLSSITAEAARQLISPILGDVPLHVSIAENHVEVHVSCGDQSGLLIGREGQTLSALQYLASRIVSTQMEAAVRVQINAGDYRERQDERLRELAYVLAERVRATGRSCSTRPMSSYHRRIIHLALQDSPDVQTRSSGEGPLKRIIVQKRKTA